MVLTFPSKTQDTLTRQPSAWLSVEGAFLPISSSCEESQSTQYT